MLKLTVKKKRYSPKNPTLCANSLTLSVCQVSIILSKKQTNPKTPKSVSKH